MPRLLEAPEQNVQVVSQPYLLRQARPEMQRLAAGMTIAELLAACGMSPTGDYTVQIDDVTVAREWWGTVRPKPGRLVVVRAWAEGGDDKATAGIIILAVVAILSLGAALLPAAFLESTAAFGGFGIGATWGGVINAGIGIGLAASMVVGAMTPPPTQDLPSLSSGIGGASRTAISQGVRNALTPYAPIPKWFGRRRIVPPLAGQVYHEVLGDQNELYLMIPMLLGFGPLATSDWRMGDTPLQNAVDGVIETDRWTRLLWTADADEPWLELRNGWPNEPVPSLYNGIPTQQSIDEELNTQGLRVIRTTAANTNRIGVIVAAPRGVGKYQSDGDFKGQTLVVQMEYRRVGESAWVDGGELVFTKSESATFRSKAVPIPAGQYEVGLTRTTAYSDETTRLHDLQWVFLKSYQAEDPVELRDADDKRQVALATLRVKNDQASALSDRINCIVESILPDLGAWAPDLDGTGFFFGDEHTVNAIVGSQSRTIECWFATTASSGALWQAGSGVDFALAIEDGSDHWRVMLGGGANDLVVELPNSQDGQWHHVAVTYNGTDVAVIYDGVEIDTKTIALDTGGSSTIYRYTSYVNGDYKWTPSAWGSNRYYLELAGGGNPGVVHKPTFMLEDGVEIDEDDADDLDPGEWDRDDVDNLGYKTLYARLTDGADPDSKADGYLTGGRATGSAMTVFRIGVQSAHDPFDRANVTTDAGDPFFVGKIRDVRVWTTAKSEAEIAAAKDAYLDGDETDLIALYPMDEGSGAWLYNRSAGPSDANIDLAGIMHRQVLHMLYVGQTAEPGWVDSGEAPAWRWRPTRNPASCYRDALQGFATKRSRADSQVLIAALAAWHARNETNGFHCDLAVDQETTLLTVLKDIASAGRASWGMLDNLVTVIEDIERTQLVQVLSPRNCHGFEWFKAFDTIPHAWEVTFDNEEAGYAPDVMMVYRDGYNKEGTDGNLKATEFAKLERKDETNPGAVWKKARFDLAQVIHRPEIFSATVGMEHLVATRGDLVRVVHPTILVGGEFSPRIESLVYDLTSYVNATYKWTASGSGADEYYLEANGGGDPSVSTPARLLEDGAALSAGAAGSLSAGEWDYGDNDSLGFDTLYVRLSDGADPDSKADGFVQAGPVSGLNLDDALVMEDGKNYQLRFRDATGANYAVVPIVNAGAGEYTTVDLVTPEGAPDFAAGDLGIYEDVAFESLECIIKSVRPDAEMNARLELVDHGAAGGLFTSDTGPIPPHDSKISRPPDFAQRPPTPSVGAVRTDEAALIVHEDGTLEPGVMLTLTNWDQGRTGTPGLQLEAQWRRSGDGEQATWSVQTNARVERGAAILRGLEEREMYRIRLRYIDPANSVASLWWTYQGIYVVGRTTPPPAPDFLMARSSLNGQREFVWTVPAPLPRDFAGVEIRYYEGTTSDWDAMTPIQGRVITDSPHYSERLGDGVDYTVAAKSLDTTGNYSDEAVFYAYKPKGPGLPTAIRRSESENGWPGTLSNAYIESQAGYHLMSLATRIGSRVIMGKSSGHYWDNAVGAWDAYDYWDLAKVAGGKMIYERIYSSGETPATNFYAQIEIVSPVHGILDVGRFNYTTGLYETHWDNYNPVDNEGDLLDPADYVSGANGFKFQVTVYEDDDGNPAILDDIRVKLVPA